MDPAQNLLSWIERDGVAVALLVYVLVRLDGRLNEVLLKVQQLVDLLADHPKLA